ncbi:MAG TPA: MFS transporter [Acetobacteraceae bacterium]|jgi:MFS family permease|nr:MFS transporter [Acetobacteraceae bacterium]
MSAITDDTAFDGVSRRQILTAVIASGLGWALDLFDLFILLYVAPIVGQLFFPSNVATLSLAAVYASFAVTLLMRPVGSALFGSYADRHGRKGAMIVAVIGVGVSTALFGALPTIRQIGIAAPIIFLLLRLVQGIFVGGVVASTHTMGTESVPPKWRGAMSGLIGGGGGGLGGLIASVVYLVMSELFPGDQFAVWGWRCMFFSGIISAFLGVFIFSRLEESPIWASLKRAQAARGEPMPVHTPVRTLFSREYRATVLVNIMLSTGGGAGNYLTIGFLPTFLKLVNRIPNRSASVMLIASGVVATVAAVSIGHLSTIYGRRRSFIVLGLLRLVVLPFGMIAMAAASSNLVLIAAYTVLLTVLNSGGYAPLLIFFNERFPTAVRSTGTGLSWNIGFAIGGIMPAVVSLAAPTTQSLPTVLAIFLVGISIVYLVGAFAAQETSRSLH